MQIPYTSDEFIAIMEKNANLHDEYDHGLNVLNAAAQALTDAAGKLDKSAQSTAEEMKKLKASFDGVTDALEKVLGSGVIFPNVVNDSGIVPTGTYATATYYNVEFGVKVSYDRAGNVYLMMKGGTTTAYENLDFQLASAPSGVSITTSVNTGWSTSTSAGQYYCCMLSGIVGNVEISLDMSSYNASSDYTVVAITVEKV